MNGTTGKVSPVIGTDSVKVSFFGPASSESEQPEYDVTKLRNHFFLLFFLLYPCTLTPGGQ